MWILFSFSFFLKKKKIFWCTQSCLQSGLAFTEAPKENHWKESRLKENGALLVLGGTAKKRILTFESNVWASLGRVCVCVWVVWLNQVLSRSLWMQQARQFVSLTQLEDCNACGKFHPWICSQCHTHTHPHTHKRCTCTSLPSHFHENAGSPAINVLCSVPTGRQTEIGRRGRK